MANIRYLTVEEIILMNSYLIKEITPDEFIGVKEPTVLYITVEAPKQVVFGKDVYPTLEDKASIYFVNLIKKHCFHNGNKRTAYMALHVFLRMNGLKLSISTNEAVNWCVEVAKWPNNDSESLKEHVVKIIKENTLSNNV